MMKEEGKDHYLQEKIKRVIGLMKKEIRKKLQNSQKATPKQYCYNVKKEEHDKEECDFVKAKAIKSSASKEQTFHNFEKCVIDTTKKL